MQLDKKLLDYEVDSDEEWEEEEPGESLSHSEVLTIIVNLLDIIQLGRIYFLITRRSLVFCWFPHERGVI